MYKMPPYSQLFRQTATNFHVTINTCPFLNIQTIWHKDWDSVNYFYQQIPYQFVWVTLHSALFGFWTLSITLYS